MPHLVYFISAHGFGHAARAAAIMAALRARLPECRLSLFTTVPAWFFEDSLPGSMADVEIEPVDCDLGMVQTNALEEDLPATVRELERRIPFSGAGLEALARRVDELRGDLVIADIAPLGLAVARSCGLPGVLVENFTWDWIYRGYLDECPELGPIADYFESVFAGARLRIQTEPVCAPCSDARRVAPVSRTPRTERAEVRRRLGVPDAARLVVLTMGGVPWSYETLAAELSRPDDPWLVIPGHHGHRRRGRLIRLPYRSELFHPDLIHAADGVVGKLGYSTVAEVWRAGVPFGYLTRPRFPESAKLEGWVRRELTCRRLDAGDLESGHWLGKMRGLLEVPPNERKGVDGADEAARLIAGLLI